MARFGLRFENGKRIAERHSALARDLANFCGFALNFSPNRPAVAWQ